MADPELRLVRTDHEDYELRYANEYLIYLRIRLSPPLHRMTTFSEESSQLLNGDQRPPWTKVLWQAMDELN